MSLSRPGANATPSFVPAQAAGGATALETEAASPAPWLLRRFLLASMAIGLTAGAGWGVLLLARIAAIGSYTGVPIHHVNAHGHAQVFGWVGLAVMGGCYHLLPRLWRSRLVAPRLAMGVLVAMSVGIVLRAFAMPQPQMVGAVTIMAVGGAMQVLAVVTFAVQLSLSFKASPRRLEAWGAFVLAAIGWFVLMSAGSLWHAWAIMAAPTRQALLAQVMAYQAPLRDVQLYGMALFVILGLSLRLMPTVLGVPRVKERWAWIALGVLLIAVAGKIALFIGFQWTWNPIYSRALLAPWLLLVLGVGLVVWRWRLWRRVPRADPVAKFVRAGYLWLAISLLMLLLLPAYQAASGLAFSHAYYGAVRHALTVGFISMMLMGAMARVVAAIRPTGPRAGSALWGPFVLINLGCAWRVLSQPLTDWHAAAFGLVGVSGVLELAALVWWAGHIVMRLYAPARLAGPPSRPAGA